MLLKPDLICPNQYNLLNGKMTKIGIKNDHEKVSENVDT